MPTKKATRGGKATLKRPWMVDANEKSNPWGQSHVEKALDG